MKELIAEYASEDSVLFKPEDKFLQHVICLAKIFIIIYSFFFFTHGGNECRRSVMYKR